MAKFINTVLGKIDKIEKSPADFGPKFGHFFQFWSKIGSKMAQFWRQMSQEALKRIFLGSESPDYPLDVSS